MPQPGISYPTSLSANPGTGSLLQDYVFASGIHKPEHSNLLAYKYPQFYMTSLLERLGASEGIGQDTWSWNTMDRTRKAATLTGGTLGTASVTFTTDLAGSGYFIPQDVLRTNSGALLVVTATGESGGFQTITVKKVGGGNIAAADIDNGETVGHVFTSFGEASSAPAGRNFLPNTEYGQLSILRRSLSISGDEFTNRTYLGDGKSWYFENENILMNEMAKDRENLIMFGVQETDGTRKVSKGILDFVENGGKTTTFASAAGVAENDIQEHIKKLLKEGLGGSSKEYTVLCGADIFMDIQKALKDYAIDGALAYGSFGDNLAGLDFNSYQIAGVKANFVYYEPFEDVETLPFRGTPTAADTNFSNFSLWLDMGVDSAGERLIKLKHKELDGVNRKLVHAYETGMVGRNQQGGEVANGDDSFKVHLLSQIGVQLKFANRMGILRANS